jgi:(1->4)-alpha-D-glucan 1-alpha-D-glucosylmutase
LHALFPAKPNHVSPYSPSSRIFLNPVYLDVTRVPDFGECKAAQEMVDEGAFQSRLAATRGKEFVDYPEVWELKSSVLEVLHRWFRDHHLRPSGDALTARGRTFRHFRVEMGESLQNFAVFEALQDHFRRQGASLAWGDWPTPFRDPGSPVVSAFAEEIRWRRVRAVQEDFRV